MVEVVGEVKVGEWGGGSEIYLREIGGVLKKFTVHWGGGGGQEKFFDIA